MSTLQEFKERELNFRIEELAFRREELAFRREELAFRVAQAKENGGSAPTPPRQKYRPTGEESVKNFTTMFSNSDHIGNSQKNSQAFRQVYTGTGPYRQDDGYLG